MKTGIFALLSLMALCGTLAAQPPMDRPPPGPGPGMDSNDAGGLPPTERWMERMRRRHPEEYERMQQLRTENPAAFRGKLREKVDEKRVEIVFKEYPALHAAYLALSPEDQARLIEKLYERHHPGPGEPGFGPHMERGPTRRPDDDKGGQIMALDQQAMELGRQYKAETDEAKKEGIKTEIRAKLTEIFEISNRYRGEKIDQMEKRLEELNKVFTERKNRRDEYISRRLEKLTGEEQK